MGGIISKLTSGQTTGNSGLKVSIRTLMSELANISCSELGESETQDLVASKFRIEIARGEIAGLSSTNAKAYHASSELGSDYYCLVFKKSMPTRLAEMMLLKAHPISGLITPVEIGIAPISSIGEKALCAICPKPKGRTLKEIINGGYKFQKSFLMKNIIPQINKILCTLHDIGIVHGSINPSTIYLDETDNLTVASCITDIAGATQHLAYEVISRAQSHKYGKGGTEPSIDYYALGMTLFSIYSGVFYDDFDNADVIKSKLQDGTYNFLSQSFNILGTIGDIVKGLVSDESRSRWGYKEVEDVIADTAYQSPSFSDKSSLSRPIVFHDTEYYSKASLAHALFTHWDDAKVFAKQTTIKKWLSTSIHEQPTVDGIERLTGLMQRRSSIYSLLPKDDEYLMKLIMLLDPNGPVRYKQIAFHSDSTGHMLAYATFSSDAKLSQFIANILFIDLFSFYDQLAIWLENNEYSKSTAPLKRATNNMKGGGLHLGIERCLYDLNPTLPLQYSFPERPLFYGIADLLKYLNKHNVKPTEITSQKDILCFLASKIGVPGELKTTKFEELYRLSRDHIFLSLTILAAAQQLCAGLILQSLCEAYANELKKSIDGIVQSRKIRAKIISSIDAVKRGGDLVELKRSATDTKYAEQDSNGLIDAINRATILNEQLEKLKDVKTMEDAAKMNGLSIAVNIGYILLVINFISTVMDKLR